VALPKPRVAILHQRPLVPYVESSLIRTVETSVKVELAGTYTQGMTVCDLRSVRPGADAGLKGVMNPNARVAVEARSRPLMDLVIEAVLAYE
jgi:inosine-uridine nucleoside N-ribohydrolase